jgi:hypothetical protein
MQTNLSMDVIMITDLKIFIHRNRPEIKTLKKIVGHYHEWLGYSYESFQDPTEIDLKEVYFARVESVDCTSWTANVVFTYHFTNDDKEFKYLTKRLSVQSKEDAHVIIADGNEFSTNNTEDLCLLYKYIMSHPDEVSDHI